MAHPYCETCAAFSAITTECRRKSPQPIVQQVAGGQTRVLGIYPGTSKDGWCAEWQADAWGGETKQ